MIKVYQLAKNLYQVTINGSTSVGDLNYMKEVLLNSGYLFHPSSVHPIAGIEGVEYENKLDKFCDHRWKEYEGIYTRFYFCSICDEKKDYVF